MELTSSADFLAAVLRAKALAIAIEHHELTPALLRAGFSILVRDNESLEDDRIAKRGQSLQDSCGDFDLSRNLDLTTAKATKFPISRSLQRLIAGSYNSVLNFVDELLIDGTDLEESNSDDFGNLVLRASACARAVKTNEELQSALLGVAAYFAYLSGEFLDKPGIAIHIALSRVNIEAAIKKYGWEARYFEIDGGLPITLSDKTLHSLEKTTTCKVLAVVNAAARAGSAAIQQRVTAYHEAGHAVASFVLRPQVPIAQVSIFEAADFAGRTVIDSHSPYMQQNYSARFFREELEILLAGGVAQQILSGHDALDEGARSDIERASVAAWEWVACLGLDECFGPIAIPALVDQPGYQPGYLSDQAQARVQSLVKKAAKDVKDLLTANWQFVESLADLLLDKKIINANEIVEVFIAKGLTKWPGVRSVRSRSVTRDVEFASTSGICETTEGPVRYKTGDAIVTGMTGEQWPIERNTFDSSYFPIEGVVAGVDGKYVKKPREALALPLSMPRTIALKDGRGLLSGCKDDWVVDYGDGDLSIVKSSLFEMYYEIVL